MHIYRLIKPLGILTYLFLLLTVITGLFLRKLGLRLPHHKTLAIIALLVATVHGILILILTLA